MNKAQERARQAQAEERTKKEAEEPLQVRKLIEVWVCPELGCDDFFGSPNAGDLRRQFTGPLVEERPALRAATGSPWRHNRAECPSCRKRGKRVQRQRLCVTVTFVPEFQEAPELPSD